MLLYVIRHGHPDYSTDTLTPEGVRQAELTAAHLADAGVTRIYSSPLGRARQTAQPLADRLGLPVQVEPWAYELGRESYTTYPDGEPKLLVSIPAAYYQSPEFRDLRPDTLFEKVDAFRQSGIRERWRTLTAGLDGLLARSGYVRNADGLYDPAAPSRERIALYCHAAMGRVLMSHMLNLPYQYVVSSFIPYFTSITVYQFFSRPKGPFVPRLVCYGDAGHLAHGEGVLPPLDSEMYE